MTQERTEFKKYVEQGAYHWKKTYDVPFWRRGVRLMARYDLVADQVAKHVKRHATGMDVGCGDGFLVYRLTRQGYMVTGLDASKEGLTKAEARLRDVGIESTLIEGTAYDLPTEAESQDFVVSVEVIEHLNNPVNALQEIYRVLKPGGVFVCTTPQRTPTQATDEVRDPYHVKEYIGSELTDELDRVFEDVEVLGGYPKILDRFYRPSQKANYATQLIRLLYRGSAAVGMNPYLFVSSPAKSTDQLLIGVARKS